MLLITDGWTDGGTDGLMGGWIDGWMGEWMNEWMNENERKNCICSFIHPSNCAFVHHFINQSLQPSVTLSHKII